MRFYCSLLPAFGKASFKPTYRGNLHQAFLRCTFQLNSEDSSSKLNCDSMKMLQHAFQRSYCSSSRTTNKAPIQDRMTQVSGGQDGFRTIFSPYLSRGYANIIYFFMIPLPILVLSDISLVLGKSEVLIFLFVFYFLQARFGHYENTYKVLVNDKTNEVKFIAVGPIGTREQTYSLEDIMMTYIHNVGERRCFEALCRRKVGMKTVYDSYTFTVTKEAKAIEILNYFSVFDCSSKMADYNRR